MIYSVPAAAMNQVCEYDEVFVPAVFHPWGCLLIGALAPEPDGAGLDVGTGPGTVARILASCLGSKGSVVGVDTSVAMLELAASKPTVDGATVHYVESDAACADLPSDSFDVVTCQQILQFVPDLHSTLAGLRRVCRTGGKLGIVVWSSLDSNPLFQALHDAVDEVLGASAALAFREPWSLSSTAAFAAVAEAGFTDIIAHTRTLPASFHGGPPEVARFYSFCACSADIATSGEQGRAELHRVASAHLATMTQRGKVHATTTATVILARA